MILSIRVKGFDFIFLRVPLCPLWNMFLLLLETENRKLENGLPQRLQQLPTLDHLRQFVEFSR